MNHLAIITGNQRKFDAIAAQMRRRLPDLALTRLDVDLPEPQTADLDALLAAKIAHARTLTALPFIVDDLSCVVEGLGDFPGALTKGVVQGLGAAGLRTAFPNGRSIALRCSIGFSHLDETRLFRGEITGEIRHPIVSPSGAMPLNAIVRLPDQNCRLGEAKDTHRSRAIDALCGFLEETAAQERDEQAATARRWSERAAEWPDLVADPNSYVNHENGYARFNAVLEGVLREVDGPRCLDVGCGTGDVSRLMAAAGAASVLGIDASAGMIERARALTDTAATTFAVSEIDGLPRAATFDVIASRGVVLSHLPRHRVTDFLRELTSLAHERSFAVFDFIQNLGNGGFANAGAKNAVDPAWLRRAMRELGWVPVASDGGPDARVAIVAFHRPFPDSAYFVTGNPQKLREMRVAARHAHLHACNFDLPELKDDDIARIAEAKARQAFDLVGRTVVSTDGGIFFDAYDGFPGPNSKSAVRLLKPEGLLRLLDGASTRRGSRRNAVAVFDGATCRTDTQAVAIEAADAPRGSQPAYPMDRILVPVHERNPRGLTYAEMPVDERVGFTELPALAEFVANCLK